MQCGERGRKGWKNSYGHLTHKYFVEFVIKFKMRSDSQIFSNIPKHETWPQQNKKLTMNVSYKIGYL